MQLKLNKCIGAYSNCRKKLLQKKYFHFVNKEIQFKLLEKKSAPAPQPEKQMVYFLLKNQI